MPDKTDRAEAQAHPLSERKPTCPSCGSTDVRQWDLVPVPYELSGIKPDGTLEIAEDNCENPAWDGGTFDELRCRDCDHASDDPLDFYPWTGEQERAESLVGCVVQMLDGDIVAIEEAAKEANSTRWWVVGVTDSARGRRTLRARPHEVKRLAETTEELRALVATNKALG